MRALSWIRDLISSERGNVFVVGAAAMPLLIGSAAFAVDTIQLSVWKRQLQRAADSSAIAGAYAVVARRRNPRRGPSRSRQERLPAAEPGRGDRGRGRGSASTRTVRVTLTATREPPFMSIFTQRPHDDGRRRHRRPGRQRQVLHGLALRWAGRRDRRQRQFRDQSRLRNEEQLHRAPSASPPAAPRRSPRLRSPRSAGSTATATISSSRRRSSLIPRPRPIRSPICPIRRRMPAEWLRTAYSTENDRLLTLGDQSLLSLRQRQAPAMT